MEMSNSLAVRLQQSLRQGEFCDAQFLVSEKREAFQAHRVILSSASPVFRAMFHSDLSACQNTFELPDIDSEAFRNLLDFAYTDSVSGISEGCVFDTLYAAKKYLIQGLADACCKFLTDSLSPGNALDILRHCLFLDAPDVLKRSQRVACNNWDLVLPQLPEFSAEVVGCLLVQDVLPCTEPEVFACLLDWADAECRRRGLEPGTPAGRLEALGGDEGNSGGLLECVRFGCMSPRQLLELVVPTGLLSSDQLAEACMGSGGNPVSRQLRFPDVRELSVVSVSVYDYARMWRPELPLRPVPLSGSVDLRCERRLALTGCELFRPMRPASPVPLIVASVRACADPADAPLPECLCDEAVYQNGQLIPYYSVNFPRPVMLRPGVWYRLHLSLSDMLPDSLTDGPLLEPGNRAVQLQLRPPTDVPYAGFLCALLCHYSWPMRFSPQCESSA